MKSNPYWVYRILLTATALATISCQAETYGFRRDGSGLFPEANPPTEWSTNQNVVWRTPMPAISHASPILVGDKVFVCSDPDTLLCVNAADGKIMWQKAANGYNDVLTPEQLNQAKTDEAKAAEQFPQMRTALRMKNTAITQMAAVQKEIKALEAQLKDKPGDPALTQSLDEANKKVALLKATRNESVEKYEQLQHELYKSWSLPVFDWDKPGISSTTPVSDGKHIYVNYGTGVAACYDLDGNRRWIRFVEKPNYHSGQWVCPIYFDDKLFVSGRDTMHVLNASDGKELWARAAHFTTAILSHIGREAVVVLQTGEVVRGRDGKTLVRGLPDDYDVSTPVVQDGVIYENNGQRALAANFPTQVPEEAIEYQFLWKTPLHHIVYFSGPIVHDGLMYALEQAGWFTVLNAKTGEIFHEKKFDFQGNYGDSFVSNLTLAGKYIYVSYQQPKRSTTIVLETGKECKEVARNELDRFTSTPVFRDKRMYLRTDENLYCIGK